MAGLGPTDHEFGEVLAAFPPAGDYPLDPDKYAEHIHRLKQVVAIPVIGSLNGRTRQSWLRMAKAIQDAGADALELNMYNVVSDVNIPAAHVEDELIGIVRELRRLLTIPFAVKLSPFFTALANVAHRLDEAGADGLVLFNRFYQPDIDIRTRQVTPQAELSSSAELLLRLRWVAILHGRIRASLALTGGVATPADGIKALLAGADAVQLVSALLRHGPAYVDTMRRGLTSWLEWNEAASLESFKGSVSLQKHGDPSAFERAHYIRTLHSWTK